MEKYVRNAAAVLAITAFGATVPVHAQDKFPSRPLRIVVPSSPGGGLDVTARTMGQHLSLAWGQSVVVDNRAGAGGTLGPDLVAKAAPDGYTILIVSSTYAVNAIAYPKLPYHSVNDFAPITLATTQSQVTGINAAVPARNMKEFIAYAKARPGKLNYSSPGVGTYSQLAFELFKSAAGLDIVHVPYKGAGLSVAAAVAGETQAVSGSTVTLLPHVKSGKLRALGTTGKERASVFPDVPTMIEHGLPGATAEGWFGFLVPAKTPPAVVTALNKEFTRVLRLPEVREQLMRDGSVPVGSTPKEFYDHLTGEIARLEKPVKALLSSKN
jgi:tripartite-type tricarboxylate transporter receptor subunit TctC